jgi:hypothetical protein
LDPLLYLGPLGEEHHHISFNRLVVTTLPDSKIANVVDTALFYHLLDLLSGRRIGLGMHAVTLHTTLL